MAEGEGALGSEAGDKRNKNDFALWKVRRAAVAVGGRGA